MDKQSRKKQKQSLSRFKRLSKRSRTVFVLAVCIALVSFICLPLMYNGYLFPSPVKDEVFAATARPTPTIAPTPEPAPLIVLSPPAESPSATPSPSPTPDASLLYKSLKVEDDDEAVAALQERLMELGYFDYDVLTTYYGTVTQSAVMLFQRTQNLPQTGVADPAMQALLFSADVPPYQMKLGDKGSDIKSMQHRLSELGYYEEKDNGYFGVATERAVQKFQKRNKLQETGTVSLDIFNLLYSPKARPLVDPTPTPKPTPSPTPKPTSTPKPATPKPTAASTSKPSFDVPVITPDAPVTTPGGPKTAPTPVPTTTPSGTPRSQYNGETAGEYGYGAQGLIAAAKAQLGKPYVTGGRGPDEYDCSGLIYFALRQAGVNVGRYTALNYSQLDDWRPIYSLAECRAGDLLFYKSDTKDYVNHTGIYLGNGTFIHASSSSGQVRISDCTDYYSRNFVIARRIF